MRLTHIKLAGFKSFVDPISLEIPSQLVGVVGPNGCGKSNIMDAVRWVLGESKASELRGESMQDVIFNGASQRKPASRASVELIFDNQDGRIGGQWAQFAELSVKRVLTRDGTSTYLINNTVMRRKDIHEMFLGTGLGPRAYAIIGQGMISRIIESRPEELRVFLEEAAGVSKYKERRKETEHRLNDTRDNLIRLDDVFIALTEQLDKLSAQAATAQQYQAMTTQLAQTQQLLWWIKHQDATHDHTRLTQEIAGHEARLATETQTLAELEAQLQTLRDDFYGSQHVMQQAQAQLFETNSHITRIETQLRFAEDNRRKAEQQQHELMQQQVQWQAQYDVAQTQFNQLGEHSELGTAQLARAEDDLSALLDRLPEQEARARDTQSHLEQIKHVYTQTTQQIKLQQQQQQSYARQADQIAQRAERFYHEKAQLAAPETHALDDITARIDDMQQLVLAQQDEIMQQREIEAQQQVILAQAQADYQDATQMLHRSQTQYDVLDKAQRQRQQHNQRAMNLEAWLTEHGLLDAPRLWQSIQFKDHHAGWTQSQWADALQSILQHRLKSIAARDWQQLMDWFNSIGQHSALGVDAFSVYVSDSNTATDAPLTATSTLVTHSHWQHDACVPLMSVLDVPDALYPMLNTWLQGYYCYVGEGVEVSQRVIDSLMPSLQMSDAPEVVSITVLFANGYRLDRHGMTTPMQVSHESNLAMLLERQQTLQRLQHDMMEQTQQVQQHNQAVGEATQQVSFVQQHLRALESTVQEAQHTVHQLQLSHVQLQEAQRRWDDRMAHIDAELEDITAQREELSALQLTVAEQIQTLLLQEETQDAQLQDAQHQHEDALHDVTALRERIRDAERDVQRLRFEFSTLSHRQEELTRQMRVAEQEMTRVSQALTTLAQDIAGDDAEQHAQLEALLEERLIREDALAQAGQSADQLGRALRDGEEQRLHLERALQPQRDGIMQLQLKAQAAHLAIEQFAGYLAEANADTVALNDRLLLSTPPPKITQLTLEITKLNQAIAALGSVNLAAIAELAEAQTKHDFLSAQINDLRQAIDMLTDAILKIDQETRQLLQSTYDTVNQHFGELFPLLFGGGQAKLVLTGTEILGAGVQVIAQPPGKKNATIHLLSGGEKALTAIALVFAFFQLNPSPFCLLDEVDAPLDDANTERFARLVQRMSEKTQFLFISHNKIAMEMAHQLIGVTMQEKGVSRIVAVDMAQVLADVS